MCVGWFIIIWGGALLVIGDDEYPDEYGYCEAGGGDGPEDEVGA